MQLVIKSGKIVATHKDSQDLSVHITTGGNYEGCELVGWNTPGAIEVGDDDPRTEGSNEESLAGLRLRRNELLRLCDWTQMPDSPLSTENKTLWATYRDALRDLPATEATPKTPTWPTPPA